MSGVRSLLFIFFVEPARITASVLMVVHGFFSHIPKSVGGGYRHWKIHNYGKVLQLYPLQLCGACTVKSSLQMRQTAEGHAATASSLLPQCEMPVMLDAREPSKITVCSGYSLCFHRALGPMG